MNDNESQSMYPPVLVSLEWNSSKQTIVKVKNCAKKRRDIHSFLRKSFVWRGGNSFLCIPFLVYLSLCTFLVYLFSCPFIVHIFPDFFSSIFFLQTHKMVLHDLCDMVGYGKNCNHSKFNGKINITVIIHRNGISKVIFTFIPLSSSQ